MTNDAAALALLGPVCTVETARVDLPAEPGLYAWWARSGSIPGVPANPHPGDPNQNLFYVGISPRPGSKATLRSRITQNHISGNTGSSTFRYILAALLMEELEFRPFVKGKKFLLTRVDNARLSEWQRQNLSISWTVREEPWLIEAEVLRILQPSLNAKDNAAHEFYATVKEARKAFRNRAQANSS